MLTYLLLSNGTQANGDHSCPEQRCFEDFTSHQLDLRRPTLNANLALKQRTKRTCDAGAPLVRCFFEENEENIEIGNSKKGFEKAKILSGSLLNSTHQQQVAGAYSDFDPHGIEGVAYGG